MNEPDPLLSAEGADPKEMHPAAQSPDERLGKLDWEIVEIARVNGPRGNDSRATEPWVDAAGSTL